MNLSEDKRKTCGRRCLLTWATLAAIVFLVQSWTLHLTPTVWQDEVEIVEMGRVFLDPGTPWSAALIGDKNPQPALRYLGPLMYEMAYRWSGGSFLGPRLAGLLGGVLFSLAALLWLRSRGVAEGMALAVALLLLIDPAFERSTRGGRADAWPLFCAVLGCWCVRQSSAGGGARRVRWLLSAGGLSGILPLLWPTAIMLWPLILIELLEAMGRRKAAVGRTEASTLLWPLTGALAAIVIALAPVWSLVIPSAIEILHHVQWDAAATKTGGSSLNLLSSVFAVLRYSPIWFALAVIGGFTTENRLLALGFGGVLLLTLATRFYLYRYLYILPYMIPLVAAGIHSLSKTKPALRLPQPRWCLTGLAVLWACLLSFGVRNYVALQERPWRDHAALVSLMEKEIGRGPHKVYIGPIDLYYAGRQLGWQMFRHVFGLPEAQMEQVYGRCDVVVRVPYEDPPELQAQLKKLGFDDGATVHVTYREMPPEFQKVRYGSKAYGPYRVYRRLSSSGGRGLEKSG